MTCTTVEVYVGSGAMVIYTESQLAAASVRLKSGDFQTQVRNYFSLARSLLRAICKYDVVMA